MLIIATLFICMTEENNGGVACRASITCSQVYIYQHLIRLGLSCCSVLLLANGAPKMYCSVNRINVEAYPLLRHRASTVPNDLLHHWDSRIERSGLDRQ